MKFPPVSDSSPFCAIVSLTQSGRTTMIQLVRSRASFLRKRASRAAVINTFRTQLPNRVICEDPASPSALSRPLLTSEGRRGSEKGARGAMHQSISHGTRDTWKGKQKDSPRLKGWERQPLRHRSFAKPLSKPPNAQSQNILTPVYNNCSLLICVLHLVYSGWNLWFSWLLSEFNAVVASQLPFSS